MTSSSSFFRLVHAHPLFWILGTRNSRFEPARLINTLDFCRYAVQIFSQPRLNSTVFTCPRATHAGIPKHRYFGFLNSRLPYFEFLKFSSSSLNHDYDSFILHAPEFPNTRYFEFLVQFILSQLHDWKHVLFEIFSWFFLQHELLWKNLV